MAQLFTAARTHRAWRPDPVDDSVLKRLYDLFKYGPTSANCCPMRIVFVTSPEAKARLLPHMASGNAVKTETAPINAILAIDTQFYDLMPVLAPHNPNVRSWFIGEDGADTEAALRNASLQAGYFILAAGRSDWIAGRCPDSIPRGVNEAFFPDGRWQVNLICNLGHGDHSALHHENLVSSSARPVGSSNATTGWYQLALLCSANCWRAKRCR